MPNGHSIGRPNGHKIDQHLPLQGPPKFTPIGIFGSESKPSGNPDLDPVGLEPGEEDVHGLLALLQVAILLVLL
jgi:hypothetical protein